MTERPLDEEPPADQAASETADDESRATRRSRWVTLGVPIAAVLVIAALAGGIILANRGSSTSSTPATSALNYGTVARTTVAQTQSLSGTIAYTATQTIINRLTPSSSSSSASTGASSSSAGGASSGAAASSS